MQIPIKATSDGIGYASKTDYEWEGQLYEADIKDGDVVTILNEGSIEEGQFGSQYYFKIKTRNGEKKAAFNQTSLNVIAGEHGTESTAWIGKQVRVLTKKGVFAGKKGIACYFVTAGWYLDDFGDLVKDEPVASGTPKVSSPTMPQSVRDAQNLEPGNVPFSD